MEFINFYYKNAMDVVCKYATTSFNYFYNLNLNEEEIKNENLKTNEINGDKKEMKNQCISITKKNERCKFKAINKHLYCGKHISTEGKLPLKVLIELVSETSGFTDIPKVISLGNILGKTKKQGNLKFPFKVEKKAGEINYHILFFNEFKNYFGAGLFIIQYCSNDNENSYLLASHYVEVNKFFLKSKKKFFIKINFQLISSLENQPIFNKIKDLLLRYGIQWDVKDVNKYHPKIIENNSSILFERINEIINKNNNTLFFDYNSYINSF